jgi:hypothetical protein
MPLEICDDPYFQRFLGAKSAITKQRFNALVAHALLRTASPLVATHGSGKNPVATEKRFEHTSHEETGEEIEYQREAATMEHSQNPCRPKESTSTSLRIEGQKRFLNRPSALSVESDKPSVRIREI